MLRFSKRGRRRRLAQASGLMKSHLLAAIVLVFLPLSAAGEKLQLVGNVPLECSPVMNHRRQAAKPMGFSISPDRAVELAIKQVGFKCVSIFQQALYSDARNYYIVKTAFGPPTVNVQVIIIDGRSGTVTERVRK
jgi:hypothetical protein